MSVTPQNLASGPATVYSGVNGFGTTEPAYSAIASVPSASAWTDCGGTNGGVKWDIDQTYFQLDVDQLVDVPESRITKREVDVMTDLAEITMTNLQLALNGGTITASTAYQVYDPSFATSATQPGYAAVLIDAYAPRLAANTTMRRRVVLRKVLSTDQIAMEYKKGGQTFIPVKFSCHYVSSTIAPYEVVDQLM